MAQDVIRGATVNVVALFGMTGKVGVIAPGARADLLLVDGNPLEDLVVLQLALIMKDGKPFKLALS